MTPRPIDRSSALAQAIVPLVFILLWSSSFITARIGLAAISPLYFVALRQVAVAAILLVAMAAASRSIRSAWVPLRESWHHCAIAGVLINGVTLMTAHVGMVTVERAHVADGRAQSDPRRRAGRPAARRAAETDAMARHPARPPGRGSRAGIERAA
jgi:hypothetical protein